MTVPIWTSASFALGIALAAGPAIAADVSVLDEVTAPQPVEYDWQGFYAGVFGGAVQMNGSGTAVGPFSDSSTDGLVGVLGGFDFQYGNFVFGIEGDIAFSDASTTFGPGGSADFDWFGTLRGRAGYLLDPSILLFGSAGFAAADVDLSLAGATLGDTLTGYVVGGGLEAALGGGFTARAEYLFTDYGSTTGNVGGTAFSTEFDSHTVRGSIIYRFD